MSNVVPAFATRRFTLTANQKIAVWSQGAFKVSQVNGYVNAPNADAQLTDNAANSLVYTSAALASGGSIDVDAYGGLPCYVEQGSDPVVKQFRMQSGTQIASTSQDATGTLTVAQLLNGRITSTGVTAPSVLTVPTGTLLYAATTWLPGEYMEWTIQNTGANNVQLAAGTDHTLIGGSGSTIVCPTLATINLRTTLVSVSGAVGTFTTEVIARPVS